MVKALFKKQLLEANTFFFQNKKTGSRKSKSRIILTIVGFSVLMLFLMLCFFGVASALGSVFLATELRWIFFAIMGLISILLGSFGSIFNTYAGLYLAKDNELLLSMPIPPAKILFARLVSVYTMSLLYTALSWIPAVFFYGISGYATAAGILFSILLTFIISAFVSVITCALGWVIALIAGKLKNKSIITTIVSLVVLALYYMVCFRFSDYLDIIMTNEEKTGHFFQTWMYPIYQLGRGACGNALAFLIFTLITAVLLFLTIMIMSKSFIRLITTKTGSNTLAKEKESKAATVGRALLRRERQRFTSSSTYMLNCGLGIVILPAICILLLVKTDSISQILIPIEAMGFTSMLPLFAAGIQCMVSSMNCISAPSISMEGKSIWITQTLPVSGWQVLKAKEELHLILNSIPMVFCTIIMGIVLKLSLVETIAVLLLSAAFIWLTAVGGIAVNLKKPNLAWTAENIAVKQSMSVVFVLFGGWIVAILVTGGYYLLRNLISPLPYMLIMTVLLAGISFLLRTWLKTKGSQIYSTLS